MRKVCPAVIILLLLSLWSFARGAGWTLEADGKALSPEVCSLSAPESTYRSKACKTVRFTFRPEKKYTALYLSFLSCPDTVRIHSVNDDKKELLAECEAKERFVLFLPRETDEVLQIECVSQSSRRIELDAFLPLTGEEDFQSLEELPATEQADGLLLLDRISTAEVNSSAIAEYFTLYPDNGVIVTEKCTSAEKHSFELQMKALGLSSSPVYLGIKAADRATTSEKLYQAWKKGSIEDSLTTAIRRLKPLSLMSFGKDGVAAEALEKAVEACNLLAWDSAYLKDVSDRYGLWMIPSLPVSRSEAKELLHSQIVSANQERFSGDGDRFLFPGWNPEDFFEGDATIVTDPQEGRWLYQNNDFSVWIVRHSSSSLHLIWYEADIRTNPVGSERLRPISVTEGKNAGKNLLPHIIVRSEKAVFAMTGDYYSHRLNSKQETGIVIRNGSILQNGESRNKKPSFPNLDCLALMQDASMQVFRQGEYSARDYIQMGAKDVYSFGPILIQDGELTFPRGTNTDAKEPRCALGMIEANHYYAVVVEGRLRDSDGCDLQTLADLMYTRNVSQALNLDGGGSAVMYFMGEQISDVGSYSSGKPSLPRKTNEMIGIGYCPDIPNP